MDLDGDGRADVLSGSYLPGELLLFPGLGAGRFGAPAALRDSTGAPLLCGRASWPRAADWDEDGDLDLVIGNMYGKVFLARNTSGARARLALAPPEPLLAAGAPLELVATNAAPCVADWDGDGAADLLLGAGDGRVLLYRNRAARGEPDLAPAVELVGRAPDGPAAERLARPAQRARPAVWDWDADGRPDLVVGDHASDEGPAPVLDAAQRAELDAAIREGVALGLRRGELEQAAFARWLAARGIPAGEGAAHHDAFLAEWLATDEARAVTRRQDELAALQARLGAPQLDHGRVWVFLRRPR